MAIETQYISSDFKLNLTPIPADEREDTAIEKSHHDLFEILEILGNLADKSIPVTFIFFLFNGVHTGKSLPALKDVVKGISTLTRGGFESETQDYDLMTFCAHDHLTNTTYAPYESVYPIPAFTYGLFGVNVAFSQPDRISVAHYLLSAHSEESRLILLPRVRFKGGNLQDDALEVLGKLTTDHGNISPTELLLRNVESPDFATVPDSTFLNADIPVYRLLAN